MAKTLEEHFGYLSDRIKVERYRKALQAAVQPGQVVLDLGCGSGLLGLMALEAGAGKVFFVEEGDILEAARQAVANAGFADKAEFFRANSFELELPEPADVIVCDHVGYFGFDYGILALLGDARKRFLKPGGVILPAQIDLELAPVGSENCRKLVGQWRDGSVPKEFTWLAATAANTKHAVQLAKEDLLADAATLGSLELGANDPPYFSMTAEMECERAGTLDGVAGWFDCQLFGDIHMTNSPTADDRLRRPQAFLPIETPVTVSKGDPIKVTIMARPLDYIIAWVVDLPATGQSFSHTTFSGLLLDGETLSKVQPDRATQLNQRGCALQIVLSLCDGERTVAEVQERVLQDHPDLFPSEQATKEFVQRTLARITGE
jgi:protein arginine N-methyltransferase 1